MASLIDDLRQLPEELKAVSDQYSGDESRPLGTFVGSLSVYGAFIGALAGAIRLRRAPLPSRIDPWDLALVSVATHKVSRLLAKDPVTSPLRAPFTRFEGQSGPAEVEEEVRDDPVRKGIGELLTCPFCLGQWVATAFVGAGVLAPRVTRLVAAGFTAVAAADVLQLAYGALQDKVEG